VRTQSESGGCAGNTISRGNFFGVKIAHPIELAYVVGLSFIHQPIEFEHFSRTNRVPKRDVFSVSPPCFVQIGRIDIQTEQFNRSQPVSDASVRSSATSQLAISVCMPNTGRPSRGCHSCRQRRIKVS
jgi:hypothetical protein